MIRTLEDSGVQSVTDNCRLSRMVKKEIIR